MIDGAEVLELLVYTGAAALDTSENALRSARKESAEREAS